MNLSEIRERIKNISDYRPEAAAFARDLDRLVNDAYLAVWSEKRWTFAVKETEFQFFPDIDVTRNTESVDAVGLTVANAGRYVFFNDPIQPMLITASTSQSGHQRIPVYTHLEIEGRDYEILYWMSNTQVFLAEAHRGSDLVDYTGWRFKARWYVLPDDCAEILSLSHRDAPYEGTRQKIVGIPPRRDEDWALPVDKTADYAECYVPQDPLVVPPAGTTTAAVTGTGSGPGGKTNDYGITGDRYFELTWAFEKDGRTGPLAVPTTLYVPSAQSDYSRIEIRCWDESGDEAVRAPAYLASGDEYFRRYPHGWEGLRKRFFSNSNIDLQTGARLGEPVWREITRRYGASSQEDAKRFLPLVAEDDEAAVTVNQDDQMSRGHRRLVKLDGVYQRIRPYPRVDGWDKYVAPGFDESQRIRRGVLRYYRTPGLLAATTDTPEMPYEFHPLIVWRALIDVFTRLGDKAMSDTYERRYSKEIDRLAKRYVDRVDTQYVRQSFSNGRWIGPPLDGSTLRKIN